MFDPKLHSLVYIDAMPLYKIRHLCCQGHTTKKIGIETCNNQMTCVNLSLKDAQLCYIQQIGKFFRLSLSLSASSSSHPIYSRPLSASSLLSQPHSPFIFLSVFLFLYLPQFFFLFLSHSLLFWRALFSLSLSMSLSLPPLLLFPLSIYLSLPFSLSLLFNFSSTFYPEKEMMCSRRHSHLWTNWWHASKGDCS